MVMVPAPACGRSPCQKSLATRSHRNDGAADLRGRREQAVVKGIAIHDLAKPEEMEKTDSSGP